MTSNHQPDIQSLLVLLSTLKHNHRYFGKSYYPSDNELVEKEQMLSMKMMLTMINFFDDPLDHLSKSKYSKKAGTTNGFS